MKKNMLTTSKSLMADRTRYESSIRGDLGWCNLGAHATASSCSCEDLELTFPSSLNMINLESHSLMKCDLTLNILKQNVEFVTHTIRWNCICTTYEPSICSTIFKREVIAKNSSLSFGKTTLIQRSSFAVKSHFESN